MPALADDDQPTIAHRIHMQLKGEVYNPGDPGWIRVGLSEFWRPELEQLCQNEGGTIQSHNYPLKLARYWIFHDGSGLIAYCIGDDVIDPFACFLRLTVHRDYRVTWQNGLNTLHDRLERENYLNPNTVLQRGKIAQYAQYAVHYTPHYFSNPKHWGTQWYKTWSNLWWHNTDCPWWSYPHQYQMQQGAFQTLANDCILSLDDLDTGNIVAQGIRALATGQWPTLTKSPYPAVVDITACMQTRQDWSELHFLIHILLGLWQRDMKETDRQAWQQALDDHSLNLVINARHDIDGL